MAFKSIELKGAVGKSLVRKTGREKVTGTATFTAEWQPEGLLHAVAVPSTIARGHVRSIDTKSAADMPGVRAILTPDNVPSFQRVETMGESGSQYALASKIFPGAERDVYYGGQYLAAVIADSFANARDAALAVKIDYEVGDHVTDIERAEADERPEKLFGAPPVITVGDPEKDFDASEVTVDVSYDLLGNHHNPIEPHATIAQWSEQNGKPFLTVYDSSQSLAISQSTYAAIFGLQPKQVQVICRYVGGAFGSKGSMWPNTVLACFCAKLTGAPVKLVTTRRQMYGGTGHRTPIRQRVAIGADRNGSIKSIRHSGVASTSRKDLYNEAFTMATRTMYKTPSLRLSQRRCRLDTQVPTFMRAPAETPGLYALEAAMDEMAEAVGLDPIEFRIRNEPERDPYKGKPYSSRLLVDCMRRGGEAFRWSDRSAKPRSQRDGGWLIGTGMAAATYPYFAFPTSAKVTLNENGTAHIDCCSQELGTGTRTVQCQLLADLLGISAQRVSMDLGNTKLPPGGISGGSSTACSVGGAVRNAIDKLRSQLVELAKKHEAVGNVASDKATFDQGRIVIGNDAYPIEDLLEKAMKPSISAVGKFETQKNQEYARHSYGAHFVEVAVDEDFGLVRVRRMLGCFACGTILNARTGRSQFLGGMIMGVGHALQEATHWDHRYGRITNDNLAEYHVPVNADIPEIEVMWNPEPDFDASPIGAKGIGEIGITGVAAAVANAVYHATGKRIRRLPITPEAVMA